MGTSHLFATVEADLAAARAGNGEDSEEDAFSMSAPGRTRGEEDYGEMGPHSLVANLV